MESAELTHIVVVDLALKEAVNVPAGIDVTAYSISPPYNELHDIMDSIKNSGSCLKSVVCIIPSTSYQPVKLLFDAVAASEFDAYISYVCVSETPVDCDMAKDVIAYYSGSISNDELMFILNRASFMVSQHFKIQTTTRQKLHQMEDTQRDFDALINIGKALSIEKNPSELLKLILHLSKTITGADAGSIYLTEEKDGCKILRFKHSHTFSKDLPYEEFTIPVNKNSIAGYVAVTQQILNIPDVYQLGPGDPVAFNSSFDTAHSYRSKSMLVVPMINHMNNTIGVIQLINSKEDLDNTYNGNEAYSIKLESAEDFKNKVISFQKRYENLMEAVASQAAIAIENNRMMRQIQQQFEEFARASVAAIESRDAATSGHSFRVADISLKIAQAINEENAGSFAEVTFTETQLKELEFAALLHDFGKVYIDTAIFLKSHKLYPKDLENVLLKLDYLYRYQQLMFAIEIYNVFGMNEEFDKRIVHIKTIESKRDEVLQKILDARIKVMELNNPMVQELDVEKEVNVLHDMLKSFDCANCEDIPVEIFNGDHLKNLKIKRGSLNDDERREIESHVVYTYNFVSRIPWPPEFEKIPEIAVKHHEKLDGTGYPYRIKGEEIPLQARIVALADIFDALIATDRPYKPPITLSQALNIMQEEGEKNKLDKELVSLFINKKIFEQFDRNAYRVKS